LSANLVRALPLIRSPRRDGIPTMRIPPARGHLNSFIALATVSRTPHTRGIPTNPHARISFTFIELS
jgi:hypothetical protein